MDAGIFENIKKESENYLVESDKALLELGVVNYGNHMVVFRGCFDAFERIIKFYSLNRSLTRKHGKTALKAIQEILTENGVVRESDGKPLSISHIRSLLNIVRTERNLSKSRKGIIRKQSVENAGSKKDRPSGAVEVTASIPAAAAVAEIKEKFEDASRRLNREHSKGLVEPWDGRDEYVLRSILLVDYRERKGWSNEPFWKCIAKFSFKFSQPEYADIAKILRTKLEKAEMFEAYEFLR